FTAVRAQLTPFLAGLGFRPKRVRYVPVSGLTGENVASRDPRGPLAAWYDGPTFLEAVDAFTPAPRATERPFRMTVSDVGPAGRSSGPGGAGVIVSGKVLQGRVRPGERVLVMPLGDIATVTRIERGGTAALKATAGDATELSLAGFTPERIAVGGILCKARTPAAVGRRFDCQIVALPALATPIVKGTEFQLHTHAVDAMVHCSRLAALVDSGGEVLSRRPRCVLSGQTAHIRLSSARGPLCLERYGDCRPLGRFVLRQRGATVAVGLVLAVVD
ncbi:unnamed protein product, partial [Phaeothamnion confervicola]